MQLSSLKFLCPIVSVWPDKHLFIKHLLFHIPVNCSPFPLMSQTHAPFSLVQDDLYIYITIPDCLWNLCLWIPYTYIIKLWVFPRINLFLCQFDS